MNVLFIIRCRSHLASCTRPSIRPMRASWGSVELHCTAIPAPPIRHLVPPVDLITCPRTSGHLPNQQGFTGLAQGRAPVLGSGTVPVPSAPPLHPPLPAAGLAPATTSSSHEVSPRTGSSYPAITLLNLLSTAGHVHVGHGVRLWAFPAVPSTLNRRLHPIYQLSSSDGPSDDFFPSCRYFD